MSPFWCTLLTDAVQDEQAKATAERTIEESAAKIDRKRAEIEEHEANLQKEEDVLESIRDSLKGVSYMRIVPVIWPTPVTDKTQVFHDQIEVKQKELQPWVNKVNAKRAAIGVATSERDALAKKAAAVKDAVTNAQADLEQQQTTQQDKVNRMMFLWIWLTLDLGL